MHKKPSREDLVFIKQLKWIILYRICFAIILIVSCLIFSAQQQLSFFSEPFLSLYKTAGATLFLSLGYLYWLNRFTSYRVLAYVQMICDSALVTTIIFITGSFDSIFTFLYLVVIICAAMLLLQKGSLIISTISCLQYGVLLELEYYNVITPFYGHGYLPGAISEIDVIYRIIIMILACFAVAVLSGILSAQLKGARQDLKMVQEHLKRVEKMEAVDELIAGIAHEVKNPLASLSGSIQLLHEDTMPGSYEDKLMKIILRETERLKDIVNDIRLFSKPSIKNATQVEVSELVEDTIALFSNDPKWKDTIEFKLALDDKCTIWIDPAHLKQILWNLLKNAAESIEDKGKITIQLRSSINNRVYLTIKDTGKGITSKEKRHIFDPFYTTKPSGTGLGLAIIHRLIDTYNGIIDFESTPEKGSEFTILFRQNNPSNK
jgi:two-component system sensor histidine kinase HydH